MYYVYILYSPAHDRFYIGSSAQPDFRYRDHEAGRVRSTKPYRPWVQVWREALPDRSSAEKRERYYKSGWGRKMIFARLEKEGWLSGFRVRPAGPANAVAFGPQAHHAKGA